MVQTNILVIRKKFQITLDIQKKECYLDKELVKTNQYILGIRAKDIFQANGQFILTGVRKDEWEK